MVADGTAPKIPQSEEGASYEPSLSKEELQRVSPLSVLIGNYWSILTFLNIKKYLLIENKLIICALGDLKRQSSLLVVNRW